MDRKVYIIFENNLATNNSKIFGVYDESAKEFSKKRVDELNASLSEDYDDVIDYTIEGHEVIYKGD